VKLSIRSGLRRRDFVQWIGGAAFALPCLELFELQARAQTAKQARCAVFIYTNDGMHPPAFFPRTPDPTASPTLSPLAPFKSKVLLLGAPVGADGYPMANQGITYNMKPAQHRANICFTGSKVMLPLNGDQFNAVNRGDGPSIDFAIAQQVQKGVPPLLLAMHPIGGDTPSDVTYDLGGNPQTRLSTPMAISGAVFGGLGVGGAAGAAAAAAALKEQTAVSNFLTARFGTLRSQLSKTDQNVIDQHLAAVRTYETQRSSLLDMQMNPSTGCAAPSSAMVPTDAASTASGADTQFLSPFIMDTVALAFNCGQTKVATVSFGYPGGGGAGGLRMPWLGFSDAQHGVSHNNGDPVQAGKYAKMNQWTIGQVAYLMGQLAKIATAGGTLLDETVIYLVNRHGDGNLHTNHALPSILCGGAGGYFKMGVNMMLPTTSPTKVLISIAHAMGVPLASFGSGAFADTMPVPGIAA